MTGAWRSANCSATWMPRNLASICSQGDEDAPEALALYRFGRHRLVA